MTTYDFLRGSEASASAPTIQTLEAIAPQPTLRIRVEHSRTIKDGWGYSTTVEIDGVDATWEEIPSWGGLLRAALLEVREVGENERDIRNQRDNAAKEATAQLASTAS